MALHEHTDDELKEKLSSAELGDKKTAMAEAVLGPEQVARLFSLSGLGAAGPYLVKTTKPTTHRS